MLTVVIDTNILINAWQDEYSYPKRVIDLIMQGKISGIASDKIKRENQFILDQLINDPEHYNLVSDFLNCLKIIKVHHHVRVVDQDPDDDKFISCALAGNADYIISQDNHLLEIGEYRGIKMVGPQEFWFEYQKSEGEDENDLSWASWAQDLLNKKS